MSQTYDNGHTALLVMLAAFVATFAITRVVTRLIRSGRGPFGNLEAGGVHVHHLVPGIFLLLITGTFEFFLAPHGAWRSVLAAGFAVGAALTLDEYALWLLLDDVYWAEDGRKSVDAVVFAAGIGLVLLVASNPFAREQGESRLFFAGFLAVNLGLAVVAVLKGRFFLGVGGVMIPFLALVAALRLARPGSPWFRWFYRDGAAKNVKARRRAARRGPWGWDRAVSALSGMPRRRRH
ncbi:hypothetical protein KGQ19_32410 [Catenulispora sp. NL8]|uniref:Integral membrane protein n=1 Tax=Catenulispora pinistramenti TaxID=2705254 RepID=A0ABS5KZU1_9ACTN|nr:hypothetical protein [Catenulispora pinistramenti]MBS2551581.1 hypothetical protein [Catenulispora pinistramenti]